MCDDAMCDDAMCDEAFCFNNGGDPTEVTLLGKAECHPTRDMTDVATNKKVTP
jgi:hypothetical protein